MLLSVVICTHNPNPIIFIRTLEHLKAQMLGMDEWELILVDNLSTPPLNKQIDLSWHPQNQLIVEERLGLSYARLTGVEAAKGELIAFVDDDNLLAYDFLVQALNFHQQHPEVGCYGGKAIPEFETEPPIWFFETGISLGCRDLGDETLISDFKSVNFKIKNYPEYAPIGTGMVIQKRAFLSYIREVKNNNERLALGRKGNAMTSGEDNDIVLTVIKAGWEIAYVPQLIVNHIIPKNRLKITYLNKMAFEVNRSWVKVLTLHGINPWKKINKQTLLLRRIKSYIKNKAWQNPLNHIKWRSACGKFKGLSEI